MKKKYLKLLQKMQDEELCTPQITKLAHSLQEPTSTVRDRIEHLEEEGAIEGYFPKVDPDQVGMPVLVFVLGNLKDLVNPEEACEKLSEFNFVQGVYFLVGENDILVKVRAESIDDYQEKMTKLREYIVGGGGIVVSKVFKDNLYVPTGITPFD